MGEKYEGIRAVYNPLTREMYTNPIVHACVWYLCVIMMPVEGLDSTRYSRFGNPIKSLNKLADNLPIRFLDGEVWYAQSFIHLPLTLTPSDPSHTTHSHTSRSRSHLPALKFLGRAGRDKFGVSASLIHSKKTSISSVIRYLVFDCPRYAKKNNAYHTYTRSRVQLALCIFPMNLKSGFSCCC